MKKTAKKIQISSLILLLFICFYQHVNEEAAQEGNEQAKQHQRTPSDNERRPSITQTKAIMPKEKTKKV
jgi:hypothetical protein